MAKPTASFNFTSNGLSVQFTDRSSGIVTSWLWDFGDTTSDITQNPSHTYAQAGTYTVSLAATNAEGTDIFKFSLVITVAPGLSLTIFEMVQANTPVGLAVDGIVFTDARNRWMLFLQAAFEVSDTDLFNESKWPPLARVLISKLIILDMINTAASGAMIVFANASQTYNQLSAQVTSGTVMVADYTVPFNITYPVTVNLIEVNGVPFGPSTSLADANALITYLNNLQKGIFSLNGPTLQSLGNSNILTTFNFTHAGGGVNSAFTQSNPRIVNVTQSSSSGSTSSGTQGPIKRMEAGPSVVEWYDSSTFWSNMLKSSGGSLVNGQSGGVVGQVQSDICLYAQKFGIYFPFCQAYKRVSAPKVFKRC
jgi:PKD repeat protein